MPSKVRKVIETLFNIFDKEGNLVPFKLNDIQAQIDEEVIAKIEWLRENNFEYTDDFAQETLRNSILKYRQGGVTTLVMAWYLVECMSRYTVAVMLTHDKEHSEKLLYRAKLMLKHMNGPKPKTNKLNDNEISFVKTDAIFYIGTAGSKEFGRSATITHLHCSEIAFWKDPASLMKSLFQAVPKRSGIITQETTANGWATWFQKSYYNYIAGKGGFKAHFFAWFIHNEYISTIPWISGDWYPEDCTKFKKGNVEIRVPNEKILYRRIRYYNPQWDRATVLAKLQWRREKILENLGDKSFQDALRDFNQEYPSTYEEAFTVTGGSLFPDVRVTESKKWTKISYAEAALSPHPVAGYTYTLGADFAGGTGNDNASINVLCLETLEQVYRFADSHTDPVAFAEKVAEVGKKYNEAFLVPESNSHGLAGIAILKRIYNLMRIYKHRLPGAHINSGEYNIPSYGYGWKTSQVSKHFMIGIAQQMFVAGLKLYDIITTDEVRSFTEDPATGKIDGQSDHDDCGISLFLACIGILKLLRLQGKGIFDIDDIENIPVVEIEIKATEPTTPKQVSWRDSDGNYLIPFKDMFGKRKGGRRSAHG